MTDDDIKAAAERWKANDEIKVAAERWKANPQWLNPIDAYALADAYLALGAELDAMKARMRKERQDGR